MRVLALAVDVGEAQAGGVQAVGHVVEEEVALERELRHPIGRERPRRVVFRRRENVLLPIDGAPGRGEEHLPHRALARRLQQIETA
jgi:hypothetical protein